MSTFSTSGLTNSVAGRIFLVLRLVHRMPVYRCANWSASVWRSPFSSLDPLLSLSITRLIRVNYHSAPLFSKCFGPPWRPYCLLLLIFYSPMCVWGRLCTGALPAAASVYPTLRLLPRTLPHARARTHTHTQQPQLIQPLGERCVGGFLAHAKLLLPTVGSPTAMGLETRKIWAAFYCYRQWQMWQSWSFL